MFTCSPGIPLKPNSAELSPPNLANLDAIRITDSKQKKRPGLGSPGVSSYCKLITDN